MATLSRAAFPAGFLAVWPVILDLDLPGSGGLDMLRRLRADPRTADVPVIGLVESAAEERRLRAKDLPVEGYARKLVDIDAVARAVRSIDSLSVSAWRRTTS